MADRTLNVYAELLQGKVLMAASAPQPFHTGPGGAYRTAAE
jgi:hypothetical protein